jgi:paraquat-inducible protein B
VTEIDDDTYHAMEGLHITLKTPRVGKLVAGSPVYYRGVRVGQVEGSSLSSDGRAAQLRIVVGDDYATLIRANTKFWNCSGISTNMSLLGGMQVTSESVASVLEGGVAFATPDNAQMGARASSGATFDLADKSEDAWLKWQPTIPIN